MKMNKKKNKGKSFSHYRKWGSRRFSSHPLSELLLIGSFKKRISDLSRNNSVLTSALQESLVESAQVNNLLKSYARDYNQILFARIKLNEMARNLAKFATDLEEVRNCLAIDLPAECNFFQKKGLSNGRIVKAPDVSCIDEAPELSEDEAEAREDAEMFHSNLVENVTPVIHDVHESPILYDDAQDIQKKNSNIVYKGSLTPQLNIDLVSVKPKRSTRSKGKTPSLGKKRSSGRLVAQMNTVTSPLLPQVQDSIEINGVASNDSLPVYDIEEKFDVEEKFEDVEIPLQNHSKNFIDSIKDCSVILSSDLNINGEKYVLNDDLNQSFEINKVCPLQPLNDECNSSFVANNENKSEIHENVEEINENCDELSPNENKFSTERNSQKLTDNSQNASSLHSGLYEYDEEIQCVGSLTFCELDDDSEEKNSISSMIRTSRSRKPTNYAEYFSSDESDVDSPFSLAVAKRKNSKKVKLDSVSIDNSCEKTITENAVENPSDVTEIFNPDYSVYNLDVSNSKQVGKKSKKKTSSMKSKSKKKSDLSKPLFLKCSVTKLKGGEHKFSKCETPLELKSIGKPTKKLLQNSCASPGGILKKAQLSISKTCEDKKNETLPNEIENIDDMQNPKQHSMLQTPKRVSFAPTDLVCNFEKMSVSKTIADNKKVRRTSKSAADLTELFDEDHLKTSPTDTKLHDEDHLKTSPTDTKLHDEDHLKISPTDTKLHDEDHLKISPTDTKLHDEDHSKASPSDIPLGVQELNKSILFDFSADTEMYTLTLPSNTQSLPTNNEASSEPSSSPISEQVKPSSNRKEMSVKESTETLHRSPKNIKKLSLKENKVIHNAIVSQCSLDKVEIKAAILFTESPVSYLKKPKRKSLFKELPDDDLKENLNFDHSVPEKEDSLENKIQTYESSSSSTLTAGIKKNSDSKCQITVRSSKSSTKKNKKSNLEKKSLEQSLQLIDATNVIATADNHLRRRSKQVCYKEPSLGKKLRRQ